MKKSTLGAFPFLKLSTKKNPQLHTAVLLNPIEVDVAFKDYPSEARQKLRGLWMLVGAVNGERYSAFKANAGNDIAARLTVFPTPAGAAYRVFTCQLGVHQHRFLLPLSDSKVIELLAAESKESINIYLENAGEPDGGMLYNCPLSPEQLIPAQAMSQTIDHQKKDEFIRELPSVISEMLSLQLMPSLNAKEVCVVDVSVLLPRDASEGLAKSQGDSGSGTDNR